jgi:LEA14-like dessication related protein
MMLKGTDKEDVDSVHVRISDIKTESYETLSAIKVENSSVCDTTSLIKIENNNQWHYIKPELHETLKIALYF